MSRPAQTFRDKPEQPGDLFAAVFDSARRSSGLRVDQDVREQQSRVPDGGRTAEEAKKPEQGPTDKPRQGKETAGGDTVARREKAERSRRRADETERPEAEENDTARVEDDGNEASSTEGAASPDARDEDSHTQENGQDDSRAECESNATDESAQPRSQQSPAPVSSQVMACVLDAALSQSSEIAVPGSPADTAAVSASAGGLDVVADAAPADQAGSGPVAGTVQQMAELSLTVWQSLRGVAAHMEQVLGAFEGRPSADSAASTPAGNQPVAGQSQVVQTTVDPLATLSLIAGSDAGNSAGKQADGEMPEGQRRHDGSTHDVSADSARTTDDGTRQSGVDLEFRSLLEAAGRARDRIISPEPQPGLGIAGRDLQGKGVALRDAGAVTELADVVRASVGSRHSSMTLRLDPPELGQLQIDVRMHGQELSLRLQADTVAGHDALQSRLNELRGSLEQHGFKLSQVQVELRVPQASPPEPHQERSSPQQQGDWSGQSSQESAWRGPTGGGGDTSPESGTSNEEPAFSRENASFGDERDWAERLAETGVDLVV